MDRQFHGSGRGVPSKTGDRVNGKGRPVRIEKVDRAPIMPSYAYADTPNAVPEGLALSAVCT